MRNDPRLFSARRTLTALAVGIVAGTIAALAGASWWPTLTWTVASGVLLAWVWVLTWRLGPAETKELAEGEGSAFSLDGGLLVAAVGGLVVVGWVVASGATGAVAMPSCPTDSAPSSSRRPSTWWPT